MSLMAVVAGTLVLGITRSLRSTHLKTSKEHIERMLLQAFRFAAVSGHVGDVVITQSEDGTWNGYINLWEIDSRTLRILGRTCTSIGQLAGIDGVCLNGCSVHKATFRFFGSHGLSTVYAKDQHDRELDTSDFGFSPENITHKERELEISLLPTKNPNPSEKISLKSYLLSIVHYPSFPNEYLSAPQTS